MSNTIQTQNKEFEISQTLGFFITLSQVFSVINRRFDHMGGMIGFNDFIILYHLQTTENKKLRRIDLAEKTGLTASGITRQLPVLEKLKLIERESDPRDARVSFVALTLAGQRVFMETVERAEYVAASIAPENADKQMIEFTSMLREMRRRSL